MKSLQTLVVSWLAKFWKFWSQTMYDITLCRNEKCAVKERCFRWTARPDRFWQSYAIFAGSVGDKECWEFVESFCEKDDSVNEHQPVC
jgi:hypothetical protein